jgi:hypothetical protein
MLQSNKYITMDSEHILTEIINGNPNNDAHIRRCLNIISNEPNDLIRIYARIWLEHNAIQLAKRLTNYTEGLLTDLL